MKIFIFIIFIFILIISGYWYFKPRPKLIATTGESGKITLWEGTEDKEIFLIEEAYQLTKHLLPQTLEFRQAARDNKFSNIPTTVYFVKDKDWLYIFADNYPYKAPGIELVGGKSLNHSIHFKLPTKEFKLISN